MKILQWSMTIPKDKQMAFIEWFENTAGPGLNKFGALDHEIYKVEDKQIVGRQTIETDKFIERVYFKDDFDLSRYFAQVKADPVAREMSRMYEEEFGACDIQLRILVSP